MTVLDIEMNLFEKSLVFGVQRYLVLGKQQKKIWIN